MNHRRILSGGFQFAAACLFICGLLSTSGCTTAGTSVEVKQPPALNFSSPQTIAVAVTTRDADFNPIQVKLLKDAIINGLRKSTKFDKVYGIASTNEPAKGLKLSVVVQFVIGPNMHKVQSVETSVALMNQSDGQTLGNANINVHTEWAFFGGNMNKAIASLGDQIVNFVITD